MAQPQSGSTSGSPFHGIFSFSDDQLPASSAPAAVAPTILPAQSVQVQAPQPAKTLIGQIAVDIFEQDNYYIIRAPIAGVRLSDLDIEIDDKVITIRGTRRQDESVPQNQFYLEECFWGEFSRSVTLPCTVDPKRVKATFSKDCILKVLVPKEEKVKIVRISEGS